MGYWWGYKPTNITGGAPSWICHHFHCENQAAAQAAHIAMFTLRDSRTPSPCRRPRWPFLNFHITVPHELVEDWIFVIGLCSRSTSVLDGWDLMWDSRTWTRESASKIFCPGSRASPAWEGARISIGNPFLGRNSFGRIHGWSRLRNPLE